MNTLTKTTFILLSERITIIDLFMWDKVEVFPRWEIFTLYRNKDTSNERLLQGLHYAVNHELLMKLGLHISFGKIPARSEAIIDPISI